MRTAQGVRPRRDPDLTARAQIRDAAIECFAQVGFRASFRDIATRAGVSPALITHHFGSKADLRRVCDTEILTRYTAMKTEAIPLLPGGFGAMVGGITHDQAVVTVYILRVLSAGGRAATVFLEGLRDQISEVLSRYERAGLVRASRDPAARAAFVARAMLGSTLIIFTTTTWTTPEEFVAILLDRDEDLVLPMLELYTEGLLTSPDMLDQFLQATGGPSGAPSQSGSTHPGGGPHGVPTPVHKEEP